MRERFKMETVMGILLLAAALLLSTGGVRQAVSAMAEEEQQRVVIDPGHGGSDPGKVGVTGALEKEINLAVSLKLKECLEKKGVQVILTRESDAGLASADARNQKQDDMRRRCEIIDEAKADLTVSIHQNSYTEESVCGPQVFYYTHSPEGEILAGHLQEALNTGLAPERPREIKANDTYYILKKTKTPTVIAECGFLSNHQEEAKLQTEEYQQQVAEAICEGVLNCLKAQ